MSEPVFDPAYWSDRLAKAIAREQAHYAVFEGSKEKWEAGRVRQAEVLKQHIRKYDSVLDVGCGWGRLLGIMPKSWVGDYYGIDVCPEFVKMAQRAWPGQQFHVHDFREPIIPRFGYDRPGKFTWAVCCSIKPMVIRNTNQGEWDRIEGNIRRVADKILLLGYDDLDDEEGVV